MKKEALNSAQLVSGNKILIDLINIVRHPHDARGTNQYIQRQGIDLACAFDEMRRASTCVPVCAPKCRNETFAESPFASADQGSIFTPGSPS